MAPADRPCQRLADRAPAVYLRTLYRDHPALGSIATVFTIHNLAYQGVFWHHDMPLTGLRWDVFTPAGIEFYGKLNFLKGGARLLRLLTTVSRTYAPRSECREFGNGLEGVLEERSGDLHGVVNGIDYEQWNPARTPRWLQPVLGGRAEGRCVCREALRRAAGARRGRRVRSSTMVTRLAWQKGLDLALESLPGMLEAGLPGRAPRLGRGAARGSVDEAAARNPGEVAVRIGYDSELASRMYAGATASSCRRARAMRSRAADRLALRAVRWCGARAAWRTR